MSVPITELYDNKFGVALDENLFVTVLDALQTNVFVKQEKSFFLRKRRKESVYFSIPENESEFVNFLSLTAESIDDVEPQIFKRAGKKIVPISSSYMIVSNKILVFIEDTIKINDLLIQFDRPKKNKASRIQSVSFYNTNKVKPPFYGHLKTAEYKLENEKKYRITFAEYNTLKAVIFFKFSARKELLKNAKWKAINVAQKQFLCPRTGFYKFMIVYDYLNPISMIGAFNLKLETDLLN